MAFSFLRSFRFEHFKATFLRFPLSILSGAVATGCAIWMSSGPYGMTVPRLWLSSFVGILMFTGLAQFAERHRLRSLLIQLLGIPLLYLLVYRLDPRFQAILMLGTGLCFLWSLALIFVGPYALRRDDKGFWQYFVRVWSRAMFAIVTAVVVVMTLELALISVENLFSLSLDSRWSEYIPAIFLVFVPNVVFLMGVPSDFKALEKNPSFSFRALGTFLFAPLLSVYFLILVAYVVKILVTQVWPDGFVAMPIVTFASLGFVMVSLVFPLLSDKKNRFLRFFSRGFLWSLPVFLIVYFVAFGQRIGQYGITELRYLGIALGVLMMLWALYFGWAKNPRLRAIPCGLLVVPLLVSFGPWGVFHVSENSQRGRLEALLEANGLLKDGVIVPGSDQAVDATVQAEISRDLDYLVNNYGEVSVASWFGGEAAVQDVGTSGLMAQLGLTYQGFGELQAGTSHNFTADGGSAETLTGYNLLLPLSFYPNTIAPGESLQYPTQTFAVDSKTLTVSYDSDQNAIVFSGVGKTLQLPLKDFMNELEKDHPEGGPLAKDVLSISVSNSSLAVKVVFNALSYQELNGALGEVDLDADLLVKLR